MTSWETVYGGIKYLPSPPLRIIAFFIIEYSIEHLDAVIYSLWSVLFGANWLLIVECPKTDLRMNFSYCRGNIPCPSKHEMVNFINLGHYCESLFRKRDARVLLVNGLSKLTASRLGGLEYCLLNILPKVLLSILAERTSDSSGDIMKYLTVSKVLQRSPCRSAKNCGTSVSSMVIQ